MTMILEKLKRKLSITWDDDDTNKRLEEIIEDAKPILEHKIGASGIDFEKPGIERNLFLNYCMYAWNNCSNEFDKNYIRDIVELRTIYEVKHYEANQQEQKL
ncbi:MAG: hypothetical protein ACRC7N_04940 [Clostridium sp.]